MKTCTTAEASQSLESLCDAAIAGRSIGIMHNGQVVKLEPVSEGDLDYLNREYGLTDDEVDTAIRKLKDTGEKAIEDGTTVPFAL